MNIDASTNAAGAASMTPGLSKAEVAERLRQFGLNELAHERGNSPVLMLVGQFKSPVVLLLLGACIISASLGAVREGRGIFDNIRKARLFVVR